VLLTSQCDTGIIGKGDSMSTNEISAIKRKETQKIEHNQLITDIVNWLQRNYVTCLNTIKTRDKFSPIFKKDH